MSCKEKGTAIILVGVLIFMFFAMAVDKNQIMLIPCAIGCLLMAYGNIVRSRK